MQELPSNIVITEKREKAVSQDISNSKEHLERKLSILLMNQ